MLKDPNVINRFVLITFFVVFFNIKTLKNAFYL